MLLKGRHKAEEGIFSFLSQDETVKKIADFYNDNCFPNYKANDTPQDLIIRGDKNYALKQISEKMKFQKNILEVGSGTCQLSMYMALKTRSEVYALDATKKSLELGRDFSKKYKINNIKFINAEIKDDIFYNESFDLIWCSGVLHHTKDPYLNFQKILKYLKPNGYIVIGLYNKIGRLQNYFNKFLFKIFSKSLLFKIDPVLRELNKNFDENKEKINAWYKDQYMHPLESAHTYKELEYWFKKNEIEFINVYPKSIFDINENYNFFKKIDELTYFQSICDQINLFNRHSSEGGLFTFIGKKNVSN